MGKKGFVTFLFFGGLLAVVLKYVYLIIPAILTITFILIIRRKKDRNERENRGVIYIRR